MYILVLDKRLVFTTGQDVNINGMFSLGCAKLAKLADVKLGRCVAGDSRMWQCLYDT